MALVEAPRAITLINPSSRFARDTTDSMCVFQVRFELISTPRYLNEGALESVTSPSLYIGAWNLRFLVMCMTLDLDGLKVIPFRWDQSNNASRSFCTCSSSSAESICLNSTMSSANKAVWDETEEDMLLMNRLKSFGPSTLPWGTPDVTLAQEEAWPKNITFWVRLERKE